MTTHSEIRSAPHFVYRLLGRQGRVLYIGCSMNVKNRIAEHRRNARVGHLVARIETSGPYGYAEARATERAQIVAHQPPFNTEWTSRDRRGRRLA